jgi:hypothetical protein
MDATQPAEQMRNFFQTEWDGEIRAGIAAVSIPSRHVILQTSTPLVMFTSTARR